MFSFLKGNVLVMAVTRILGMFSRSTVLPYVSLYVLALGGTSTSIGYINSLAPLASLLIFPIAGFIADQSGRVKLIATARYLSALSMLLYIFANNWIILAIGSFISGMTVFHFPAQSALMADSISPKQRGIGFATYNAIPGAIAVIAPYVGGYLIDKIGVNKAMIYLYTLVLVADAISATIQIKFLKETIERPRSNFRLSNLKTILAESYSSAVATLKWMPKSLRALAFVIAASFTANMMVGPFWVVYGTQTINLSASEWGLITLISSAFRIAISIPAGVAVDRFGRKKTIATSFLLSIPPLLYFTRSNGFLEVLLLLLMLSAVNAFTMPACLALMADIIPREMRGRVMAALGRGMIAINLGRGGGGGPDMGFVFAIPVIFGSLIGGYIYKINPTYPWILQSIVIFGSFFLTLILIREPEKAEL